MARSVDFSQLEELERLLEGRAPAGKPSFIINDDPSKGPIHIDINGAKTIPQDYPLQRPKEEKKAPAPKKEKPIQKEATVHIEANRISKDQGPIRRYNVNPTDLGEAVRENYNALVDDNINNQEGLKKKASDNEKTLKTSQAVYQNRTNKQEETADDLFNSLSQKQQTKMRVLRNLGQRLNEPIDIPEADKRDIDSSAFQRALKAQLDELSKPQQDVSELDKMIAGLGPLLVGLAGGGEAGFKALGFGNSELDRIRKSSADERRAKIEGLGKQIDGAGRLLSAEAAMKGAKSTAFKDREEIVRNRIKDFEGALKDLTESEKALFFKYFDSVNQRDGKAMDADEKLYTDSANRVQNAQDDVNQTMGKGIDAWSGTEQKALDEVNDQNEKDLQHKRDLEKLDVQGENAKELEKLKNRLKPKGTAQNKFLKEAGDLRKEFQGRPIVKEFNQVKTAYEKVRAAAEIPSAAGDLSLIFGYMKMLDPGSTVREGEFANAQNAAGIPDRIRNLYNRAAKGERLGADQRADFIQQANNIYKAQAKSMAEVEAEFSELARVHGVDPNIIFKAQTGGESKAAPKKKQLSEEDQAAIDWAKKNPKNPKAQEILKLNGL